jgi:hypothetical protein
MQPAEDALVAGQEAHLGNWLVQQSASLKGPQVIAPAVGNCGANSMKEDDVGQKPAAVVPGRRFVIHPGQAAVLVDKCDDIERSGDALKAGHCFHEESPVGYRDVKWLRDDKRRKQKEKPEKEAR